MKTSPPWYAVWIRALRPSVAAYEGLLSHRDGVKTKTAIWWTLIAALVGYLSATLRQHLAGDPALLADPIRHPAVGLLLFAGFRVLSLLLVVGVGTGIAWGLGGTGEFHELAYAYAAILLPLTVIHQLALLAVDALRVFFAFSFPPNMALYTLGISFWIYQVILSVAAARAVHDLGWGKVFIIALPVLLIAMPLIGTGA